MAATLRFAGGLHIVGGQIVVEAELDTAQRRPPAAPRHRRGLRPPSDVLVMAAGGLRKGSRYVVRVVEDGEALARQTGLHRHPRPSRARPAAQGRQRRRRATPRPPGAAPSSPTARSPSPAARRPSRSPAPAPRRRSPSSARPAGWASRPRPARSAASTGSSSATATRSARCSPGSAPTTRVLAWEERRMRREVRATANRLANFDDANLRRSARAAVAAGAAGRAGPGDPRRGRPRPPARGRHAAARAQAGVPRGARPAGRARR